MDIPKMNMTIDIDNCESVECKCGSILWKNSIIVKRISPIQSPDGKENFANIPVIVCEKCGNDIRLAIESMKTRIVN